MQLMFNWKDIKDRGRALTYDDVLLVPNRSDIRSRKDPDLSAQLTKNIRINRPFISANMDTVTEHQMALAMDQMGAFGILHRFMSVRDQATEIEKLKDAGLKYIGASIGVNGEAKERTKAVVDAGANVITIDIAHGHSVSMLETLKSVKDANPEVEVIAGNVATPEGVMDLIEAGADAIKVGIGPGSMCTTRIITGCGLPQLTAVAICAEIAAEKNIPVIADGGLKTSGDIVKALAAGANTVMLGSLLSGTIESPGEITNGMKAYRGMASRAAQNSWRGGVPEGMAPEGESVKIPVKGHVSDVIHELSGGLRSGMSYLNSNTVDEIRGNARFTEMSPQGMSESRAHGVR